MSRCDHHDPPGTRQVATTCRRRWQVLVVWLGCLMLGACGVGRDTRHQILVSVEDQHLLLLRDGRPIRGYPIATSKFGLGSEPGSYRTPLGRMRIAQKIGGGQPPGMVFKSRRPTGEILRPDAPGRDPIVSRILWLDGLEPQNRNTFKRMIYIHGTPEERNLGRPSSYGCIRMGMHDVVDLYDRVGRGARVRVIRTALEDTPEWRAYRQRREEMARKADRS